MPVETRPGNKTPRPAVVERKNVRRQGKDGKTVRELDLEKKQAKKAEKDKKIRDLKILEDEQVANLASAAATPIHPTKTLRGGKQVGVATGVKKTRKRKVAPSKQEAAAGAEEDSAMDVNGQNVQVCVPLHAEISPRLLLEPLTWANLEPIEAAVAGSRSTNLGHNPVTSGKGTKRLRMLPATQVEETVDHDMCSPARKRTRGNQETPTQAEYHEGQLSMSSTGGPVATGGDTEETQEVNELEETRLLPDESEPRVEPERSPWAINEMEEPEFLPGVEEMGGIGSPLGGIKASEEETEQVEEEPANQYRHKGKEVYKPLADFRMHQVRGSSSDDGYGYGYGPEEESMDDIEEISINDEESSDHEEIIEVTDLDESPEPIYQSHHQPPAHESNVSNAKEINDDEGGNNPAIDTRVNAKGSKGVLAKGMTHSDREGGRVQVMPKSTTVSSHHELASGTTKPTMGKKPPPQPVGRKRSALNSAHITTNSKTNHDSTQEDYSIFADRDELEGPEHQHAVNSPTKNGRRLDNKAIVEVKPASKRRNRVKNCDLPSDILTDDIWQKVFIPILMTWAGTQVEPWTSNEVELGDAITLIGRTYVRPDFELTPLGKTHAEVSRAGQRLCDGWRTFFGSTAFRALSTFFDNNGYDTYESRVTWAAEALKDFRHLYRRVKGSRHYGFLQNELIYRTFAFHLSSTEGVEWLPGLSFDFDHHLPRGALALAGTAVSRAVKLWATGRVVNDATALTPSVQFVQLVGPHGGKPATGYAAFSMTHWHATTIMLVAKIEELINDDKMCDIIISSREFVTTSRTSATLKHDEISADDPLLLLGDDDGNGDDSEGDAEASHVPHPQGLVLGPPTHRSRTASTVPHPHPVGVPAHAQPAVHSRTSSTLPPRTLSTLPPRTSSALPPRTSSALPPRTSSAIPPRPAPTVARASGSSSRAPVASGSRAPAASSQKLVSHPNHSATIQTSVRANNAVKRGPPRPQHVP